MNYILWELDNVYGMFFAVPSLNILQFLDPPMKDMNDWLGSILLCSQGMAIISGTMIALSDIVTFVKDKYIV